jgi:hypothetical protein
VRDPSPPASGGAHVTAALPNGFDVDACGPTVVRQRYTRWWHADGACVSEAPGGWTRVTPKSAGIVHVRAGLVSGGTDCPAAVAGR